MSGRTPLVRVGIPLRGGRLLAAARERGYPVLFSANAFALHYGNTHTRAGEFRRFALPDPEQFAGIDAALDSAGFVAAVHYGDYRWTIDQYLDLVQAHPWTFWASMDYCCEPEIAHDRALRLLRIAGTTSNYFECAAAAQRRALSAPMPVLQGYRPSEYALCAEWMPLSVWPALIGIGSMCRRPLHGPNGIFEVLHFLDSLLPSHVRFHLFGVKSEALSALARHTRVASTDSMAWDFRSRASRRTGRDMDYRTACMHEWVSRQRDQLGRLSRGAGVQGSLLDPCLFGGFTSNEEVLIESVARAHAELVAAGETTYASARVDCARDAAHAIAIVRQRGYSDLAMSRVDALIDGAAGWFERLRSIPLAA